MAATAIESIKSNTDGIEQNRQTEKEDVDTLKARLLAAETKVEQLVNAVEKYGNKPKAKNNNIVN